MKTIALSLCSIGALLFTSSCSKDADFLTKRYNGVDSDLWKYYAEFEYQAELRGLSFDLNNLDVSGEISEIRDAGVAGSCEYGSAINNHVTIDKTFWNRSRELDREFVVFHELGHCVLYRDHDESQNQNGFCLSIMRSGLNGCRDAYTSENKAYYIDELFQGN